MSSSERGEAVFTPIIEAKRIGLSFGGSRVLNDVSLSVAPREVVCIIGPSGAGKSSVLRCLSLLSWIDRGSIFMEGKSVVEVHHNECDNSPPRRIESARDGLRSSNLKLHVSAEEHRRNVAMVFQEYNLWDHRTILANITEGPIHAVGTPRHEAYEDARKLLEGFGLAHLEKRYPAQLSGGERQRVALLRALALRPRVLLADEITSALDPERVQEVLETLSRLAAGGTTMILVTHHLQFASKVATRIVMMDKGRVVETGDPCTVLNTPTEARTARFIDALARGR